MRGRSLSEGTISGMVLKNKFFMVGEKRKNQGNRSMSGIAWRLSYRFWSMPSWSQ
jgi:hypothetical protein